MAAAAKGINKGRRQDGVAQPRELNPSGGGGGVRCTTAARSASAVRPLFRSSSVPEVDWRCALIGLHAAAADPRPGRVR